MVGALEVARGVADWEVAVGTLVAREEKPLISSRSTTKMVTRAAIGIEEARITSRERGS